MLKIDAHQHFWQYNPVRDSWITEDMQVIGRDFYPEDLLPVLQQNGIDGCVAVQADQSEKETQFLLEMAASNPFVKGVVGWVDLKADNLRNDWSILSNLINSRAFVIFYNRNLISS